MLGFPNNKFLFFGRFLWDFLDETGLFWLLAITFYPEFLTVLRPWHLRLLETWNWMVEKKV